MKTLRWEEIINQGCNRIAHLLYGQHDKKADEHEEGSQREGHLQVTFLQAFFDVLNRVRQNVHEACGHEHARREAIEAANHAHVDQPP